MSVTQPLRDEHRELMPRIESLRAAAEAAESGREGLGEALDEALAFLEGQLIPHAQAEDADPAESMPQNPSHCRHAVVSGKDRGKWGSSR
ncbi:MAG TPA: hypothetical protein VHR39_03470 [Propionibacteriaceae bacterium]|jgi:hypothetical protein|nr:hypothetical protein [Propionibacteriaceae bacterium]